MQIINLYKHYICRTHSNEAIIRCGKGSLFPLKDYLFSATNPMLNNF